jgi:hypothetical protein
MSRRRLLGALAALGIAIVLAAAGCSTTSSSTLTRHAICRGNLDDYRQIELTYDVREDREGLMPPRRCEQLTIEVKPRPELHFRQAVKAIDLGSTAPRGQLCFENVVARTDETRQRVWFIQRDTGRVIATLDRQTGQTTGPDDEPPPWATPTGGQLLMPLAE